MSYWAMICSEELICSGSLPMRQISIPSLAPTPTYCTHTHSAIRLSPLPPAFSQLRVSPTTHVNSYAYNYDRNVHLQLSPEEICMVLTDSAKRSQIWE
ncbi:hypothetical protein DPEC_G00103020 [Dallia pectoralis]|uniref:Uncharacterized protein n=1 Tax=Dallia pectoralis TaxID=75939 RepID=A0ACC2GX85_DALPE|nr:hypothetical protein DPEC_G00103020 [Dallia pectoralis]